ncbi:hypothetical protein JCM21900_006668 [Sporobolomyces salmonicolor]
MGALMRTVRRDSAPYLPLPNTSPALVSSPGLSDDTETDLDDDDEKRFISSDRRDSAGTVLTFSSTSDDYDEGDSFDSSTPLRRSRLDSAGTTSSGDVDPPNPVLIRRHRRCILLVLGVVLLLVSYLAATTQLLSSASSTFSSTLSRFSPSFLPSSSASSFARFVPTCTPTAWSSGHWAPLSPLPLPNSSIWTSTGFTSGCAQNWFRNDWYLGLVPPGDGAPSVEDGSWPMSEYRRRAGGWVWESGSEACRERVEWLWEKGAEGEWKAQAESEGVKGLLQDLVDRGGWLIVGDSLSEQHFFSLSCLLSAHVRAQWPYPPMSEWHQIKEEHLYLRRDSPLVLSGALALPEEWTDADYEERPLVSHVRSDHGFAPHELVEIHESATSPTSFSSASSSSAFTANSYPSLIAIGPSTSLLTPVETFSPSFSYSLSLFLAPSSPRLISRPVTQEGDSPSYAPETTPPSVLELERNGTRRGSYRALIFSTGAHFSTRHFNLPASDAQIDFFNAVFATWLDRVAEAGELEGKEILVRPTNRGHNDCHAAREPLESEDPSRSTDWNWADMELMNREAQRMVEALNHPRITFLDIDRPGKLRPDAHTDSDCLHLSVGSGVVEGWTRYVAYWLHERELALDAKKDGEETVRRMGGFGWLAKGFGWR